MLDTLKKLKGAVVLSIDGEEVGKIKDFYFDDDHWTIRYFIVNTGSWFLKYHVLISPYQIIELDRENSQVKTSLSKKMIENAPQSETERPMSRLYEEKYSAYYQIPYYWSDPALPWPGTTLPMIYAQNQISNPDFNEYVREKNKDIDQEINTSHLRSFKEVLGYKVHAQDKTFGNVEDIIMYDESYSLKYLVVDMINLFPSKSIIVSTEWVTKISWAEEEIYVNLSKQQIESSPIHTTL